MEEGESGRYACVVPAGSYTLYINGKEKITQQVSVGAISLTRHFYYYSLTFHDNGQTLAAGSAPEIQHIELEHYPTIPAVPKASNVTYSFIRWTVSAQADSASFDLGGKIMQESHAYAQ